MNKVFFIVLGFVFVFVPSFIQADEIHEWQDAQGNWHVTELPPEGPVKKHTKHSEIRASDMEIQSFKQQEANYLKRKEQIRSANEARAMAEEKASLANRKQRERNEKEENTNRLSKEFWDAVEQSRKNNTPVDERLRKEYLDAVSKDPRTVTTTRTTSFK